MPKPATYPYLFDEALQMNVTKLKKWGYLEPGHVLSATLRWGNNENLRGSISITVNTKAQRPFIELDYKFRDEPRKYHVYLTTKPSNLGNGNIWYFICPATGKLCRKLYCLGGYFLHREAFKGYMYESQIFSKKWREMDKLYSAFFNERIYEQIYKKHLKKTYAGKPTKKYAKLMIELAKAERISVDDIERLMIR